MIKFIERPTDQKTEDGRAISLCGTDEKNLEKCVRDGDQWVPAPKTYADLKESCDLSYSNKGRVYYTQIGDPILEELSTGDVVGMHTTETETAKGTKVVRKYLCFWEKDYKGGNFYKRHKMPMEALEFFKNLTVES